MHQALSRSILVVIPKPYGGFRGIGLLESLFKMIKVIINTLLTAAIPFHNGLHGFCKKRGYGMALECKLEQEKALYEGKTLFQAYLDLTKAYDTLDRDRTLNILKGNGVGPNVLRSLQNIWDRLSFVPRQGGYYSRQAIDSQWGVTQGGVLSPTLFNIINDAIVREWEVRVPPSVNNDFYTDDECISRTNARAVQTRVDVASELFERIGMKTNAAKTKAMIGHSSTRGFRLTTPAYKRRLEGSGETHVQAKHYKVACPWCSKEMQAHYLPRHILLRHGDLNHPAKRRRLLEEVLCLFGDLSHASNVPCS